MTFCTPSFLRSGSFSDPHITILPHPPPPFQPLSLSVVQLCKQEAGVLYSSVPEDVGGLPGWGCPYSCTIMGIQDGREGPCKKKKVTREDRGSQRKAIVKWEQTEAPQKEEKNPCWFSFSSVNRLLICFSVCLSVLDPVSSCMWCMGGRD